MEYIVERIKELIEIKGLSHSEFADTIGIKRATLSHVLSGRNKPSLDFVLSICNAFNDISPNNLLALDKNVRVDSTLELDNNRSENSEQSAFVKPEPLINSKIQKDIERIVVFYQDHTFDEYKHD